LSERSSVSHRHLDHLLRVSCTTAQAPSRKVYREGGPSTSPDTGGASPLGRNSQSALRDGHCSGLHRDTSAAPAVPSRTGTQRLIRAALPTRRYWEQFDAHTTMFVSLSGRCTTAAVVPAHNACIALLPQWLPPIPAEITLAYTGNSRLATMRLDPRYINAPRPSSVVSKPLIEVDRA
jgi:hypothetical protein